MRQIRVMSYLLRKMPAGGKVALLAVALPACGASPDASDPELGSAGSAVTITNCTGAAISSAVAAGGDVVLNCPPNMPPILVPPTTVSLTTTLRAAVAGTVTLTSLGGMFSVNAGKSFQIQGINFSGQSSSSVVVHTVGGFVGVSNSSFSNFLGFVLSVHQGALTVSRSTFSNNNSSSGFAGSIYSEGSTTSVDGSLFFGNSSNAVGGAIVAFSNLTVTGSTFVGNHAGRGGAIVVSGTGTITNSTFFGNSSNFGGAIATQSLGSVNAVNCTFAENPSSTSAFSGNVQLQNSIVRDSSSPPGSTCQAGGFGNLQWPVGLPLCGQGFHYGDPRLGGLANNGGPTMTMALLPGSAAIDTALLPCPTTDQRGVLRPRDGDGNGSAICDIGAYER